MLATTVFAAVAWPTRHHTAYAATGGDDDDDSASGGGDDDDSGGSAKGGDDDGGGGGDDDDDASADADQPPVNAGGLYTKATYPLSVVERPLTLIEGMTEVRVGISSDMSSSEAGGDHGTFKNFGLDLYAHYGLKDNQELQASLGIAGLDGAFAPIVAEVGYEGALSYDLVDFRAAFLVGHSPGSTQVGVDVGFPIKYRVSPQIAVIALRSLMTINFTGKPDLTPTLGGVFSPIPVLSVLLNTGVTLEGFDTANASKGSLTIPLDLAVLYAASPAIDLGLQFEFPNIKPPTKDLAGNDIMPAPKFYNERALLLFANLRL